MPLTPTQGTRMQPSRNIAARAGRWSAQHRKTALAGWIVFVVLAFVVGGKVGTNTLTDVDGGVGESGQADRIVAGAYPKRVDEVVLVQSTKLKADDPAFRVTVADVTKRLQRVEGVTKISDPYGKDDGDGAVSPRRDAVLVSFQIPGDSEESTTVSAAIEASVAAVDAAQRAHPGMRVEQSGSGSSESEFQEVFSADLKTAGTTSLPITLIILLVAFGALVAAGIPLLLAITGVVATLGLVGPLSQLAPVDEAINEVILLIGLAVGVDYALFYLRRMREERAAGRSTEAAIEAAAATSGRAVLISGVTVMIAMAGMYFGGAATFTSFATGTITVVAVAMLGSLTVLPALLSMCGDKVDKGRVPGLDRLKRRMASYGLWSRTVDGVMRRPLLWAAVSVALLLALAAPALHMNTGTPGVDTLPQDLAVVQKFEHLKAAFPSETSSLSVVIKGSDVTAPAVQRAVAKLERATRRDEKLFPGDGPFEQDVNPAKTVSILSMEVAGDGTDAESGRALDALRDDLVPATLGKVDGLEAYSTGGTAVDRDFDESMISHLPIVFAFVLVAAFLLLLVTFRSIVVPIKAIVLNLLSVGAAYGALVLVFQHGWFNSLLGVGATGPIVSWLPLFMFVILFGLSMDYHVFVLTRVRELYDRGMSTEDAVSTAIKSTAGVVTSAAVVMVCVFAVFGTLSWMMFKQMGVGLAFAILLDATLIRGVLLPATMKLLGDRNWWLPSALDFLPDVRHEGEALPARA